MKTIFYNTSKPIVGPRGEVQSRISADELMTYGVPEVAAGAATGQSFEHLGVQFEAQVVSDTEAMAAVVRQNRADRIWDVAMTAALAVIFTPLGLWGGAKMQNRNPCLPAIAQPVCDDSTGICR